MGDSEATLEVSVSFGRFENDLLAWEKWSTFPSNKYLEEVEKCSTPGSVAQKKAYFEAHYKKIAARKAEQEEQDLVANGARVPVDSEIQAQRDLVAKFCEADQAMNAVSEIELGNEVANSASEMSSDKNQGDETKESFDLANESKDTLPLLDVEKLNEQKSVGGIELESEVINSGSDSLDMENESKDLVPLVDAEKLNEQKSVCRIELEIEVINSESESLDMDNESKDSMSLLDAEKLNEKKSVSGIELENEGTNSASEMRSDEAYKFKNSLDVTNESKDLMPLIDEVKDESCCTQINRELHGTQEPALVKDNSRSLLSEGVKELAQRNNVRDIVSVNKIEKDKSDKILKSKKGPTTKKATNTTPLKKKLPASTPKSSILSTPKLSRSALSKSTMSDSRGSSKKEYGTSPLINKKTSRAETKRAAPTSLHMSLSLGPDRPANSEPAPSTTMRKSVFMEKMGDKDIVKRAFKAFRNDFNQLSSSSPDKPTLASQIPGKEAGIKASVVGTPQKKIEGVKNVVKKTPKGSQPGLRKTSIATRLPHNAAGADQRNVKSVSFTYGLRSHDEPDKRKEFSKKLEEKGNVKAAERSQSESKVKKKMEIKKLPHDHYSKTKPILGTAKPKCSLDKKSTK